MKIKEPFFTEEEFLFWSDEMQVMCDASPIICVNRANSKIAPLLRHIKQLEELVREAKPLISDAARKRQGYSFTYHADEWVEKCMKLLTEEK
jgi:hypothetical protein